MGHRAGESYACQTSAARKCRVANAGHRIRYQYFVQFLKIMKGIVSDGLKRFRQTHFWYAWYYNSPGIGAAICIYEFLDTITSLKCSTQNAGYRLADYYFFQTIATPKSINTDTGHRITDVYACQICAFIKCFTTYIGHRILNSIKHHRRRNNNITGIWGFRGSFIGHFSCFCFFYQIVVDSIDFHVIRSWQCW